MLPTSSKYTVLIIAAALILIAVVVGVYVWQTRVPIKVDQGGEVACTLEAKLCPDGSYVGRQGPQCEFAACPEASSHSDWNTFTDSEKGISFQYPQSIGTTYIAAVDWPPQIQISNEPFSCLEAGTESQPAGKTEQITVENRTYCVTTRTEGAAGSIYSLYAYGTERAGRHILLTFGLRSPQCANYDESEQRSCQQERTLFDVNSLIDSVVQTTQFAN